MEYLDRTLLVKVFGDWVRGSWLFLSSLTFTSYEVVLSYEDLILTFPSVLKLYAPN